MVPFKTLVSTAIAIAASCLIVAKDLAAASPAQAPNVTYTATGVFATPPTSGSDLFQLAGTPFSISVVARAGTPPTDHGPHWATYTKLKMTGSVSSGLEPTPLAISSALTSIELATGNPSFDVFELFVPVYVIGIEVNVQANVQMPPGTIANALIHPFASVVLGPSNTVVYADPTTGNSTTLGIARGTLVATIPGGQDTAETPVSVQLYKEGARAITAYADGTRSVRSIGATPVDLGASSDMVVLEFYASGVRDGSEIHMQIAGHDVRVLYAGPADQFPGLDEVSVEVPRTLAGWRDADVALTVDSQISNLVRVDFQ